MKRQEIIDHIRQVHPAEHGLGLIFGTCKISIKANRPEIIEFLRVYFNPFTSDFNDPKIQITLHNAPAPPFTRLFQSQHAGYGTSNFQEEWIDLKDGRVVHNRQTNMVFVLGGTDHLTIGPCLKNLGHVAKFINSRYIEWQLCRGCLLGHGAGVAINNRGLALAGDSGMGKSTLALQLMGAGANFVSNNRLLIKKRQRQSWMYGLAEWPRVNPGTILHNPNLTGILSPEERAYYSTFLSAELWGLEHKYDIPLRQCFGPDRVVLGAALFALVILNWRPGHEPTTLHPVNLAERADLWPAFMTTDDVYLFPVGPCRRPELRPENYLDYLSAVNVFEMSGGRNFEKAAAACLSCLGKG